MLLNGSERSLCRTACLTFFLKICIEIFPTLDFMFLTTAVYGHQCIPVIYGFDEWLLTKRPSE